MPQQVQRAVLELRSLILEGSLRPGQRVLEVELADRIGISRTPIREALVKLESEGLLERVGRGGFSVRSFTLEDVEAAIEIRGVMEGTVVRLAAECGAEPEQLQRLDEVVAALDEVVSKGSQSLDFNAYTELNAQFHDLLSELARSTVLKKELERASQLPFASPNAFLDVQADMDKFRRSLAIAQQHHRDMVDAIRSRQGGRAEHIAREHARLAKSNLNYVLSEKRNLIAMVPGLKLVAR